MDEKVKKDILGIELNRIHVKHVEKHPKSFESLRTVNELFKNFGINFELDPDFLDFIFYTFPYLTNAEFLNMFLLFSVWGFILDDRLERQIEHYPKWYKYLEEKECPGNGMIEKLFQLFLKEGKRVVSNQHLDTLFDHITYWLKETEKFQKVWLSEAQISDQEFIEHRLGDGGFVPCFFFIQIDSCFEITEELASDGNWSKFIRNALTNLIIINELYSVKKEVSAGVGMCNYVYIKMVNHSLSAQEAAEELIVEAETAESLARHYGKSVMDTHNINNLNEYVEGIFGAMAGNHYWSTICRRYNHFNISI